MEQQQRDLKKFTTEIFDTLQIKVPFTILDTQKDQLPYWTKYIRISHEVLIFCENLINRDRLSKFIGKTILQHSNFLYWFDGEELINKAKENVSCVPLIIEAEILPDKVECFKNNTRLPDWLDRYIFTKLHAIYSPNFEKFSYNLDLTEEDNLKYLGTYFPRSYSESFCIFENLFSNIKYKSAIAKIKTFNILSIGCGTGGDILGLLTIIEKNFTNVVINIFAVDGNKHALNILEKIINKYQSYTGSNVTLLTIQQIIGINDVKLRKENFQKVKFDYILTFKMITEIIADGRGKRDYAYYFFVKDFTPLLNETGVLIILDVTTKQEHNNTFNPILLNMQVNQAIKELPDFKALIQLPLKKGLTQLNSNGFTQQVFTITHSHKTNDISKVAYQIITYKKLGLEIEKHYIEKTFPTIQ